MVENRPWLTFVAHAVLVLGLLVVTFPVYMTFVASTHDQATMLSGPIPLLPGRFFAENYGSVLFSGLGASSSSPPVAIMMFNSLIMALAIALGKIAISIIAAYAVVYFKFPFRMTFFWMIFITLMLPVEVFRPTRWSRISVC
jgi:sn-glycerol 3-phosphate transport system permease protein